MVGNYKFKLSDMIPRAWLFKLVHMSKGRSPASSNTNHSGRGRSKASSASTISQPQPSRTKQPRQSNPRESYYFTRKLIPGDESYTSTKSKVPESDCHSNAYVTSSPTKSSQQRLRSTSVTSPSTTKLLRSSVSPGCNCRVKLESAWSQSESPFEHSSYPLDTCPEIRTDRVLPTESFDEMLSWSSPCGHGVNSGAHANVMDVDRKYWLAVQCDKLDDYDALSELELPPIVTKPAKFSDKVIDIKKKTKIKTNNSSRSINYEETIKQKSLRVKIGKEEMTSSKEQRHMAARRLSVNSPGVKLRTKSPKISNCKVQALTRKRLSSSTRRNRSLSDSYAVVKSSSDPQRDFRDSMEEMIVENNIRASKDWEDLLACYLSLNSDEYHDLIVKVFKQLWLDLADTR